MNKFRERLRYVSASRLWNLVQIKLDSLLKRNRARGFPVFLIVEPCNFCNLKCPLCPTGQRQPVKRGKMEMATFTKIIDELHPYAWHLNLFYLGEPLLCENISDMIRYARKHKMKVSVSSNLNLLDEEKAGLLIDARLDHLIVSLDATSQESYEKYRVGGRYEKVVENIRLLKKEKQKKKSEFPKIEIQFVVFRHNEAEIPGIKKLAAELGVGLYFREGTLGGEGQSPPLTKDFRKAEEWLSPNREYHREYDYFDRKPYIQEGDCGYLWKVATINWDGAVFPCCWVYENKHEFGNIMEQSFSEIWNNKLFLSSRRLFTEEKTKFKNTRKQYKKTICYQCKMYRHNLNG